ncbi:MAG: hypothetical protein ACREJC_14485 [Tepidisphaeraceae bacterium]
MAVENTPRDVAPAVLLFQKAHQQMTLLARLDEQLNQLISRRHALQEELRGVQDEINDEFDRLLDTTDESGNGHIETGAVMTPSTAHEAPERKRPFANRQIDEAVA